ncbi:MAG: hypothetical protein ACRDTF_12105 [Pseudonocardiaceae bacterium]
MTGLVSPELGRLLTLGRVRRGHVAHFAPGVFVDHGRRIPDHIRLHLGELLADGYLSLGEGRAGWGQRPVVMTPSGEQLHAKLDELLAQRRSKRPAPLIITVQGSWTGPAGLGDHGGDLVEDRAEPG